MGQSVYMPAHFISVERVATTWYFGVPKRIVSKHEVFVDFDFFTCREKHYGLTKAKIVLEFRLLTGGTEGYYLADMKHKRYYFCGHHFADVKEKLLQIGIGRRDPHE